MASIVSVEQIKGLAGGSTPNTITVPTGQTLDVADGITSGSLPLDSVVQYKWYPNTSTFDSTSNSYVTVKDATFTPKKSGNRIMARFSGHLYKYNNTNYPSSYGQLRIGGTQVWYNAYLTYMNSAEYMYTLSVVGSTLSTGTSPITVDFRCQPNGYRTYFYANTGGLEVWEIAQ